MADRSEKPYWLPDTQGFLALAIIMVVAALAFMLLQTNITFDDKIAGAFMTLLGVLTACLKDVYSFFFGSSRSSDKKDDVIGSIAQQPAPLVPPPAPWWSKLTDDEKNLITAKAQGLGGAVPDLRVAAFITAAQVGSANADDLAYLVSVGLLTQTRADAIRAG